jgi:hypothetical protein
MKFSIKSLGEEIQKAIAKHSDEKAKILANESKKIISDLKEVTPVLTGKARDSWILANGGSNKPIIKNTVSYISQLNRGSSKKAPAYFIESTVLKRAKPVGTIIDVDTN